MDRGRTRKETSNDRKREHAYLESQVDSKAYEFFKRPAYFKASQEVSHEADTK